MSCVPDTEQTLPSLPNDASSHAGASAGCQVNLPKDAKKKSSFGAFWKRKSDKSKDKKKNKFFQSSLKKLRVQHKPAEKSSGSVSSENNNEHSFLSKSDSNDTGASAHADESLVLSNTPPINSMSDSAGETSENSAPEAISSAASSSQQHFGRFGNAASASGFSGLRQMVPVPSEAMDENIRREMEHESWRSHVAYPHIHYPTSNRSSASDSGTSDAATSQLSADLRDLSLAMAYRPDAGIVPLRTFRLLDQVPPPGGRNVPFHVAHTEVTQVDYAHYLVPDLQEIARCGFYWGVMDRYEAERLLENRPEGTFLLRDSAQEEFLFSVSFRRYGRSLHARVDQWNHRFSFDTHDSGVFGADSVTALIEHYKDPSCCMFFEPMLTIPLNRNYPFSLQHLARATICQRATYDTLNILPLPKPLIEYLKYYHYKLIVNKRKVELPMQQQQKQSL